MRSISFGLNIYVLSRERGTIVENRIGFPVNGCFNSHWDEMNSHNRGSPDQCVRGRILSRGIRGPDLVCT